MNLFLLASTIIFISLIGGLSRKHTKNVKKTEQAFWDKEMAANNVRKKSLDNLDYVTIPMEKLPLQVMTDNERVQEYISTIQVLSDSKIVNFTGITNTDLKLTYGTANITVLSEYDENYSTLITTLQRWAKLLYEGGFIEDTCTLLEYAVSIGSDVSASYYLLAEIYQSRGLSDKVFELIDSASSLNSKNGKTIARTLRESYL
ncbi:MAG: hypothetical protein IJ324_01190 [Lachnospiraceae bacterium]|nr:hypothetical protein [Lachnospiraceae bacterium]